MQNALKFWDGIAEKYAASPIKDMDAYAHTLDRTRSYLCEHDHALELGCGTGTTALALAPHVAQLTATDLSDQMIAIGQRKALEQGINNVQFETLNTAENTQGATPYDVVLAFNLLHLLPDLTADLARIHRQLKPGGLFISKSVCLSDTHNPFVRSMMRVAIPAMQLVRKAPYVRFMSINELEETIKAAGFQIVETGNFPASPPNRFVVAKKL